MYQKLDNITLKSGEKVEAGVVKGPDQDWSERLQALLSHKGDPWNWQNAAVLENDLGLDVFFYILHRSGVPFANIMTVERAGVGIFGHVWTAPDDRQQGASSRLMALQMGHFSERGGQALFLGTYEKFGFQSVEEQSGYMAYYSTSKTTFENIYFAVDQAATIEPLDWTHWPAAAPLFMAEQPGVVRCAGLGLVGRASTEEPFLPLLIEAENGPKGRAPRAIVLRNSQTTAVVGMAAWSWHPMWPETCVLDVYCHPAYWDRGAELLAALTLPNADRYIAYVDQGWSVKENILKSAGFLCQNVLTDWLMEDSTKTAALDVGVWVKSD